MFALRRHFIVPIKIIILYAFLAAVPVFFYFFAQENQSEILTGRISGPVSVLALSIYALAIWLFFFNSLIDYYLDFWIVTNERIINIEQRGLFSRSVAELKLYRVQDVKAEVRGVMHTVFDYGDITVQTAGEEAHFVFKQVPKPYKVARQILELVEQDREKHLEEMRNEITAI